MADNRAVDIDMRMGAAGMAMVVVVVDGRSGGAKVMQAGIAKMNLSPVQGAGLELKVLMVVHAQHLCQQ